MPEGVTDRAADCWEPLLAIADLAGEEWAQRARRAAAYIVGGRPAEEQSYGVRLLREIRALPWEHVIASAELCHQLNALEEAPWGGWNDGKGITQRDLARRLRVFGISSKKVRVSPTTTAQGYDRNDFADAWSRYCREAPPAPPGSGTSGTSGTQTQSHVPDVPDVPLPDGGGGAAILAELRRGGARVALVTTGAGDHELDIRGEDVDHQLIRGAERHRRELIALLLAEESAEEPLDELPFDDDGEWDAAREWSRP
jgi:hypothetical protein